MKILASALLGALLCLAAVPAQAIQPNDPLFPQQWGFEAAGITAAWNDSFGGVPEVKVAVLDNGCAYDIADFAGTNFDRAMAWDFYYDDGDVYNPNDHGTQVTAVLAQTTDNNLGAAGVAFNTTILPLKVTSDAKKGHTYDISTTAMVEAIDYAVDWGADIINISLGADDDPALEEACQRAYDAGVLVVCAAGNGSNSEENQDFIPPQAPALYATTLTVANLLGYKQLEVHSQVAWDEGGPGVCAPGTLITQETQYGAETYTGTSMATPLVSGGAALLLSAALDRGLDLPEGPARVEWLLSLLFGSAEDLGPVGVDHMYGWGMVHIDRAMDLL
ncbi:MAG: S8 family serine peptidase [Deltaproteobacteria bacterium]|nr:S8 family serine peptidase [Deltaproteobacteria bacterium]